MWNEYETYWVEGNEGWWVEAPSAAAAAKRMADRYDLVDGQVVRVTTKHAKSRTEWLVDFSPHTGNRSVRRINRHA